MKHPILKLTAIAVFIIAVLTISSFALSDKSTVAIFGTPKIDGQIDSIWEKANQEIVALPDSNADLGGYTSVATDVTGVLRTMWDEEYFYVLIEVDKHGMPISSDFNGNESTNDCADVCISLDGFFGASLLTEGYPNSGAFRILTNGDKSGHGAGFARYRHEYRGKMVKTSDSTYVVEYAFPWPTIGFTLHKESVVALDIQINVADNGKRIGLVNWSSTPSTTWKETTECGIVYLEGIENMDYPTKAETLPKAKPEVIECFGTIGYSPINMIDGKEIASRFVVQSGVIDDITITCPSWMDSLGSLTFRLYEWNGDYETTIAGTPIIEYDHIDFADNSTLHLANDIDTSTGKRLSLGFGKGEYLFWIGNGSDDFGEGVGIYSRDTNANDPRVIATYINGEITNQIGMMASVKLIGAEEIVYPDSPVTEDTTAEETTVEETTVEETTAEDTTVDDTSVEETTAEETTVEETTVEETTVEETTIEETTVEETTAEEATAEETTAEETTVEETTAEDEEIAPPTADYMAVAAFAAVACGVVLILGKKK